MIGDHRQLQPSVDTFALERERMLGVSMFERLSNSLPYRSLEVSGCCMKPCACACVCETCFTAQVQFRMRPEIANTVRHIYEQDGIELKDDECVMQRVEARDCALVRSPLFFWRHSYPERPDAAGKSKVNDGEVQMAVQLARAMVREGVQSSRITILAPYSGQVAAIREAVARVKEWKPRWKTVPAKASGGARVKVPHRPQADRSHQPHVSSVDRYQGLENDYVILSLVRTRTSGFLKKQNRMCVALSRARLGLVILGCERIFAPLRAWKPVFNLLKREERVGDSLPLQCPRHPGQVAFLDAPPAPPSKRDAKEKRKTTQGALQQCSRCYFAHVLTTMRRPEYGTCSSPSK